MQEPDCQYREVTPPGQTNICHLGRFNGQVTDGMCRRCIRDGLNTNNPPGVARKVVNFAKSAVLHMASGMPMCTQEQIDARFSICQGCEFYKDGACQKCGCPLNREKQFISKLSWANEKCPVGKWGPVGQ